MRRWMALSLLILLATLITACGSAAPLTKQGLPDFLHNASDIVKETYQFAVAHQHELENYPCYCGCNKLGHLNNKDCYIQAVDQRGRITYDQHATGCGICIVITLDVKRLMGEGLSPYEIRQFIDEKYSAQGPSTDTPMPAQDNQRGAAS
jgi:hypothetical protein